MLHLDHNQKKRLIAALLFSLLLLAIGVCTAVFWESLTAMVKDPQAFRSKMEGYGPSGKLIFTALMAVQVILAPIPGHPFEVIAGYSFGVFMGTALTSLGALLGSAVAFWLSRIFGASIVKTFYNEEKLQKVSFLKTTKRRNFITFLFFLIPGVPKDMLAYFMGLTAMPFSTFLLLSTVGRLPGILVAVIGGAAANERSSLLIALLIALILLLFALTFWLSRYQQKQASAENNDD